MASVLLDVSRVEASGGALSDTQWEQISTHVHKNHTSIASIALHECALTDAHAERIASFVAECHSLSHLLLTGASHRIGNAGLQHVFTAARAHPCLVTLDVHWHAVSLDANTTRALAALLHENCKLRTLPIERLVYACNPQHRYIVLDALKINIGLASSTWSAILPLDVRILFRRYTGLDAPVAASASTDDHNDDEPASALILEMQRLSAPSLWRLLGAGAFGRAYESTLDGERAVCVKTVALDAHAGSDRSAGFFREIALAHELSARNKATLRSACVFAEHVLLPAAAAVDDVSCVREIWLVLPLMSHGSLEDACRSGALTLPLCVRIVSDVARCVRNLHEIGVLHRDVAARNVLLDAHGGALLCDLGLSCQESMTWQCTSCPVASWPPEVVVIGGAHFSRAAEVWSLGILMFEVMLGGHNPLARLAHDRQALIQNYCQWYVARHAQAWPSAETDAWYVQSDAADMNAPAEMNASSYHAAHSAYAQSSEYASSSAYALLDREADAAEYDATGATDWWMNHMRFAANTRQMRAVALIAQVCCRFAANQRPTMAIVSAALRCVAAAAEGDERNVTVVDPSSWVAVESATDALLLAQLFVLGFEVSRWWVYQPGTALVGSAKQIDAAASVLAWHIASLDAFREAGDHEAASAARLRVAMLHAVRNDFTHSAELLEECEAFMASVQHAMHARCVEQLAQVCSYRQRHSDAARLYERLVSICDETRDSRRLAGVLDALATEQHVLGNLDAACVHFSRALSMHESEHGDATQVAHTLTNLAGVHQRRGNFSDARAMYSRALGIREVMRGAFHPEVAQVLHSFGNALMKQGDFSTASSLLQRARAIFEAAYGAMSSDVAACVHDLAVLRREQGAYGDAMALFQQSLAAREHVLGPRHMDVAECLNSHAEVLRLCGNLDEALPLFRRALAISEAVMGTEHLQTMSVLANVALVQFQLGEHAAAQLAFERVYAAKRAALGDRHADVAQCVQHLAAVLRARGNLDAALPLYQEALAIFESVYEAQHPKIASALCNLGNVSRQLGDVEASLAYHTRALSIQRATLGAEHVDTGITALNMAILHHQEEQHALAVPLYEHALAVFAAVLGSQHQHTNMARHGLMAAASGVAQAARAAAGQDALARKMYERAVEMAEVLYGHHDIETRPYVEVLAAFLVQRGEHAAAADLHRRLIITAERAIAAGASDEAPHLVFALKLVARWLLAQGASDEAHAVRERIVGLVRAPPTHEHPLARIDAPENDEIRVCSVCGFACVPHKFLHCGECDWDECDDCVALRQ